MPRIALALLKLSAVLLAATAVVRDRDTPGPAPDPTSAVEGRTAAPPRFSALMASFSRDGRPRLLDTATGGTAPGFSEPSTFHDFPSCSPWHDALGRCQVVTVWRRDPGQDGGDLPVIGLARFTYPDRRPIDRVGVPLTIHNRACWLPGPAARVVFSGGDGALHRVDFGGPERTGGLAEGRQRLLQWRCPLPGGGRYISEPYCPATMAGGPWIFAVVYRGGTTTTGPSRESLCWLRLDDDAETVEGGGMLMPAEEGAGRVEHENYRCPVVAESGRGTFTLAFLSGKEYDQARSLCIVPVEIDPSTGVPRASWGRLRILAERALLNPPAFSPDGRSVFAVVRGEDGMPGLVRLANPLAAGDD